MTTGIDAVREGIRVRSRLGSYMVNLARDVSLPVHTIEAFLGGAELPIESINVLAQELFADKAVFIDPDTLLLRKPPREVKPLCAPGIYGIPYDATNSPYTYKKPPEKPAPPAKGKPAVPALPAGWAAPE